MQTLRIAVGPETLTLRKADGEEASIALPELPQDQPFLEDIAALEKHFSSTGQQDSGSVKVARRLGKRLFEVLCPNQEFVEAYQSARDAGGLRLVLEFTLEPPDKNSVVAKWAALPWEYLLDPEIKEFLVRRADCRLVRCLGAGQGDKSVTVSPPMKILAVFAEPWDLPLYRRAEALRHLEQGVSGGRFKVRVEPQPTFPALILALADYKPHVLHIVAHGSYIPGKGGGLALEDEFGGTHGVLAHDLASQIRGSGVKLVVLNTCLSGAGEGILGYRGVAHALLRAGVPAVVAMQYIVPVVTAQRFSSAIYHALSREAPLDEAVCVARRMLSGDLSLPALNWAIPVLYMQGDQWKLSESGYQAVTVTVEPVVEKFATPGNLQSISHLRSTELFGRAVDMAQVARALREPLQRQRFVTVTGMGGIGKTAVAVESAFWHHDRCYFPDGVFGVSAKELSYIQLLSGLGQALCIPEFDKVAQQEQEQIILSILERKTILLVIDNVDGLRDDASFRRLLERITPGGAGRVLLTCRRTLDIDGEKEVPLKRLPLTAAISLFFHVWNVVIPSPKQVAEVASICGRGLLDGHPLAVVIAASLARKEHLNNLTLLIERLQVSMAQTLKDRRTPEEEVSIVSSLNISYQALGDEAKQMLPRLAVFEGLFREQGLEAMCGDLADWRQGIKELLEHNLLEKDEVQTSAGNTVDVYRMHPVTRSYGLDKVEDKKALHLRAGRFLVSTKYANENVVGIKHLEAAEVWEEVISAVWKIEDYLDRRGLWAEDEVVLEAALRAARASGSRKDEGALLNELGSNHLRRGDARGAIEYYQQALTISREIGDRSGEESSLGSLGIAYDRLGKAKKAIEYYEQALAILREMGDKRGEGSHLGNLGIAYDRLGEVKKAIEYHEQALAISREMGDKRGEGSVLGNLGLAYARLGEVEKAIDYHEQALAISREIGDRSGEGSDLGNLGSAYFRLGEVNKAVEYYQQALAISREIGDKSGEGNHLGNLGLAYSRLGEMNKAVAYHEQALAIDREIGDKQGEGNSLGSLGLAYSRLGEVNKAVEYYQQALAISREIGDKQEIGRAHV